MPVMSMLTWLLDVFISLCKGVLFKFWFKFLETLNCKYKLLEYYNARKPKELQADLRRPGEVVSA